tara:strand:- start:10072 stop:10566 length:495 start_codon:yes stop_codon:yes gene_type:complete
MWIVAKYDKKKANFFLDDLKKKLKDKVVIYNPKVKIEKFYKKKLISKEFNILGDYIFCFNPKFANQKILDNLQFTKGLKYFLSGFYKSQKEIKDFIKKCKKSENENGFISADFFDIELNKKYKFNNGPLLNLIFQVVEIQKTKFKVIMGDKIATIEKGFLFSPL